MPTLFLHAYVYMCVFVHVHMGAGPYVPVSGVPQMAQQTNRVSHWAGETKQAQLAIDLLSPINLTISASPVG